MKIRDIVNRDIVNLTNCEQEPIHIPGSIQPHGFLLGIKKDNFVIDFCSANSAEYINLFYSQLLGKSFSEIFGETALQTLTDYIDDGKMLSSSLLNITLEGVDFLCTVHLSGTNYILEAEPVSIEQKAVSDVYNHTKQFLSYLSGTQSFKELCQLVAKGTREITGYDRVMVYRFDKDYNGEVFAESVRDDLEPFLGLHYPHTDIPAQARKLYTQNLLRLITDIDYTPVPIYTLDDDQDKTLDLSLSTLRSVSPIHVQYLQNMGVGATLTISLIYKNKLWGLIACHHYSPKNLSPEIKLAAQLQGHFITSQIDLRQSNEEYEIARKTNLAFEALNIETLSAKPDTFKELVKKPDLLKLCNAFGVSVFFNGEIYKNGLCPHDDEILFITKWLAEYSRHGSFVTNKLVDYIPEYKDCKMASGIIYHSLSIENNNCIIWYRPETLTEINWAGDPTKSIIKDEKGMSPRNSFKLWREIVDCMSKPWLKPETDTAAAFAYSMQRQINLILITQEEEKYRKLSELLKQTNSELENINWISTHDLQEPLRKIQLLSSRILTRDEEIPESVQDTIQRMNASAARMQTLLIDILKYTRLRHTDDSFEKVNLNLLIEEITQGMDDSLTDHTEIITEQLPDVHGIPFLLKQLFSNLISNSIKYIAPGVQPKINISSPDAPLTFNNETDTLYNVINISDNGIGFDQKYAESIFNIFTRLHSITEYKGSGVGLALCKKIMQNHNGYITANSTPGKGTVMSLYFPVKRV
ncbi:ATP-binding protein [Flavobacterium rhizosphaerae]|uniref:histidine kinase n=1 Tax=Flavobacterium rhizosphaerae TaxID=3163298 RepID=A0ABW8YV01_9FLAO